MIKKKLYPAQLIDLKEGEILNKKKFFSLAFKVIRKLKVDDPKILVEILKATKKRAVELKEGLKENGD